MPKRPSALIRKHFAVFLGQLLCVPLMVSAQGTAPVTVIVQFEELPPAASVGSGGGDLGASTISAAGTTSFTMFDQVVLPSIETRSERDSQPQETAQRLTTRPRTFGGTFRYERVNFDNDTLGLDGNIFATNIQMAWDVQNFSVGFLIPYEYLDLRNFDVNQVGTILYAEYNLRLSPSYTLGFIANGNYMYSAINNDIDDVNTFGGGASVALTMDRDMFVVGGGVSYQYNTDDTGSANDHQHLIKLGAKAGLRIGQRSVVSLFSTWNYDATDYKQSLRKPDNNYFDLGFEASWSLTSTWNLNGGYKHILGLRDFDSNQVFVGTLFRF